MESTVIDGNINRGDLSITPEIHNFLKETAKWAKFISIVGFVMIALFLILAVSMGTIMNTVMADIPEAGAMGAFGGGFIGIIYGAMALIYVFPVLYLYRFATKMKVALANNDQEFLRSSFENLKSCYKFMGIFMAVVLGFYAIMLVFALLAGGMAAFM